MADRTLAQVAYEEQKETRAKIDAVGLPHTSSSNRPRVNNTDAAHVDSQGIAGSLARRAVPNVSFNMGTQDAYEAYSPADRLAAAEADKQPGTVGSPHTTYKRPGV
jgi:hypothetical protein